MSRRALLSAAQRDRLFATPVERAEMARHYVLGADNLALIRSKRRGVNRLGFAAQHIADLEPVRRTAILVAQVVDLRARLTDATLAMFEK